MQKYGMDVTFEKAERYFDMAAAFRGNRLLNDVRAVGRFALLAAPDGMLCDQAIGRRHSTDNVDLQLSPTPCIARQADRSRDDIEALNAGINGYLVVLKNSARRDDAAFNYEYLVRVREEIEKGRRKPDPGGEAENPLGTPATPEKANDMKNFKTYVPLTPTEMDKAEAGKGGPIKRKG